MAKWMPEGILERFSDEIQLGFPGAIHGAILEGIPLEISRVFLEKTHNVVLENP